MIEIGFDRKQIVDETDKELPKPFLRKIDQMGIVNIVFSEQMFMPNYDLLADLGLNLDEGRQLQEADQSNGEATSSK